MCTLSHPFCGCPHSIAADISTSFRKGCIPRPLQNTANTAHEEDQHPIIGIPPPAQTAVPAAAQSLLNQAAASTTGLSLGEACRAGARASTEPVIAAAAAAAAAVAAPVLTSQDLGLSLDDDPASVISSGSDDSADGLWAEDPLASFDRVLDGLLLAPALAQTYSAPSTLSTSTSSSSGGSSQDLISLLDELQLHQGASTSSSAAGSKAKKASRVSTATQSVPSSWRSSSSKSKSMPAGAAAAAAGPAVTVVHCETEYERELAAAAALQQLLVVKVESSHHLVREQIKAAVHVAGTAPCLRSCTPQLCLHGMLSTVTDDSRQGSMQVDVVDDRTRAACASKHNPVSTQPVARLRWCR